MFMSMLEQVDPISLDDYVDDNYVDDNDDDDDGNVDEHARAGWPDYSRAENEHCFW